MKYLSTHSITCAGKLPWKKKMKTKGKYRLDNFIQMCWMLFRNQKGHLWSTDARAIKAGQAHRKTTNRTNTKRDFLLSKNKKSGFVWHMSSFFIGIYYMLRWIKRKSKFFFFVDKYRPSRVMPTMLLHSNRIADRNFIQQTSPCWFAFYIRK